MITIAYDVGPYRVYEIRGNTNEACSNISAFLSWILNAHGRLILAFEQYLKHTKNIDEICHFPFDETYVLFNNGTLAGSGGKINISDIDIWEPDCDHDVTIYTNNGILLSDQFI